MNRIEELEEEIIHLKMETDWLRGTLADNIDVLSKIQDRLTIVQRLSELSMRKIEELEKNGRK